MESVDGSKSKRLFGFCFLLSGLDDDGSVVRFVTFLTDTPPHGAGIVKVFENAKISPDARPSEFDSAMS